MELSSRSFSNMQLRKQQPNKRLKLAGADRFKGSGVLCPWRGTDCRPLLLRRRASRPQLKRDPLGGSASTCSCAHLRFSQQCSCPVVDGRFGRRRRVSELSASATHAERSSACGRLSSRLTASNTSPLVRAVLAPRY